MKRESYYSVSEKVARLIGDLSTTYRTKHGRFVFSQKQMTRLESLSEEPITPADAFEITEDEARKLIQQGGYQMGEVIN